MMKHVVVLAGYYHPTMSPPSACIDKYVRQLYKDFDFDIISQKSHWVEPSDYDIDVNIHYVTNWWNDLRNYSNYKLSINGQSRFYNVLKTLVRLYGVIKSPFSYPSRLSWLKKKYIAKLEELNKEKPIDVIISVSNPVCTHIAAQRFVERHPNIKWITYSTDPFTYYDTSYKFTFSKSLRKKRNYKTELGYYNASYINMLTEELYGSAIKDFHLNESRIVCFPYVFTDFSKRVRTTERKSDTVKLVYAGALNSVIRNPDLALSVLSRVRGIDLILYQAGDCGSIIEKYSQDNIIVNGLVDRERYVDIICNDSDILVNIGNNSELQAPSKMLELFSTGKPIINFYRKEDTHYRMIEKYPLGLNIGANDEDAVLKVETFCDDMKTKRLSFEEVESLFPDNSLKLQTLSLRKLIS